MYIMLCLINLGFRDVQRIIAIAYSTSCICGTLELIEWPWNSLKISRPLQQLQQGPRGSLGRLHRINLWWLQACKVLERTIRSQYLRRKHIEGPVKSILLIARWRNEHFYSEINRQIRDNEMVCSHYLTCIIPSLVLVLLFFPLLWILEIIFRSSSPPPLTRLCCSLKFRHFCFIFCSTSLGSDK